ncbi:hypothetical protein GCM10010967_46020 [Dyadobacter beijingensis]|uniref:3-oxoacyl-ACP synthase n=1 Tax=Dyadobacter beijingensis TaxID=365489 RepID=A0ABQ2IBP6_9BACT|nr:hypothetical protein [Dyadobacter beijingensis]GGN05594.1 hypothetical protein GCM10010967_46020 [Dyadobacter beijingensis]
MKVITAYCNLRADRCLVNGEVVAERDPASEDSWFKQIYKKHALAYPKFYKMDVLSQAGYLASELIKKANPGLVDAYADDEIALIFANATSSAETDRRFKQSYEEAGTPSPSLFVYTLPNIVLGEIAIANKWYGENMFAVLPKFAPGFYLDYGQILSSSGSRALLCGWLEVTATGTDVFLFMVEERETGPAFSHDNLLQLSQAREAAAI